MHFQNKQSDYNKLLEWVEAPIVLLKYRLIYIAFAINPSASVFTYLLLLLSSSGFIKGAYLFISNDSSFTNQLPNFKKIKTPG